MFSLARRLVATSVLIGALTGATALVATPAFAAPSNDNFASAIFLPQVSGQTVSRISNASATAQPGEPAHFPGVAAHKSIWFTWLSPATQEVVFRSKFSTFDTVLAVYQQVGSGLGGLVQLKSSDDEVLNGASSRQSMVTTLVGAGQQVYIAVDSFGSATGDVNLTWTLNDTFNAAEQLSGPAFGGTIRGSDTDGTTFQVQEPAHANDPAQHSTWFTWTAPKAGTATFEVTTARFDTQLAVYTGNSVTALTLVAANDDQAPGNTKSKVSFPATAGATYKIALDGFQGQSGNSTIKYTLV